jgi:hypothetical protein
MRKKTDVYLDDDDDLDVLDRYDVVPDGFALRTRLNAMDGRPITELRPARSRPTDLRNHAPGYRYGTDEKSPTVGNLDAARDAARSARAQWVRDMTSAWKRMPGRDAEPDAPAEAVETQLEVWLGKNVTPADVERRRRAQHAKFAQDLSSAWKGGR